MKLRAPPRLLAAGAAALVCASWSPALASGAITLVQKGPIATGSGTSVTATLSSRTTGGDLLVATIEDVNADCSTDTFSAPAGWTKAAQSCRGTAGPIALWYLPNASAGITSVVFQTGSSGASTIVQLSEWAGAATTSPLDTTGTKAGTTASTTLTVSTSAALASTGELAVTGFLTASALTSFTPGSGWTSLRSYPSGGLNSDYRINPASGAILSESVTSSPSTTWGAVIATFLPPCSGGPLTLETSPTVSFPAVTLNAYDTTSTVAVPFTLNDMTGSGAGWNLNATSTTFTASGGKTLSTTATTVSGASASAASGNCNLPSNGIAYPVTLPAAATPPTAAVLYAAALNTGKGPTTVTLTTKIALPANTKAGSYSSTWTLTLASGP